MEFFVIPTHFYLSHHLHLSAGTQHSRHASLPHWIILSSTMKWGVGGKVKLSVFSKYLLLQGKSFQSLTAKWPLRVWIILPSLYMLFCRYWQRSFEYQKPNINISDLGITTLCLAFIKDDFLILKLFLNQQVSWPVSLIQSGVNSRRINSLAPGFSQLQNCQEKPKHPASAVFLKASVIIGMVHFEAPAMLEIGCLVSQNAWPWPGGKCQAMPECTAWFQNDELNSLLRRRALC